MDQQCEGVGQVIEGDPPPDEAMMCPVCGRETRVEPKESDDGLDFTIAAHQKVIHESP